jgi:hypothetical protein
MRAAFRTKRSNSGHPVCFSAARKFLRRAQRNAAERSALDRAQTVHMLIAHLRGEKYALHLYNRAPLR